MGDQLKNMRTGRNFAEREGKLVGRGEKKQIGGRVRQ